MPVLIRKLGLAGGGASHREEIRARREMIDAALGRLQELRRESRNGNPEVLDQLEGYYRRRLARLDYYASDEPARGSEEQQFERQRTIAQQLRNVERAAVLRLRNENKIHDEVLRDLEYELDLLDARFAESE
jgi:CPA1 family monovalent cation:H+ antiporter